jgi:hypothetical protein
MQLLCLLSYIYDISLVLLFVLEAVASCKCFFGTQQLASALLAVQPDAQLQLGTAAML